MPTGVHLHAARRRPTVLLALAVPLLLATSVSLAGCTSEEPPTEPPEPAGGSPTPARADGARDDLAALAAAAQDRHLTARYTLTAEDGSTRTIIVTSANDGSWRVDVPGWALGGTVDVALVSTAEGFFQCALPSATRPGPAGCVRLGDPDDTIPRRLDPRVQHPFTDWLDVLTDRQAPLAVSVSRPLPGATGTCYSVESTSASLNPPLDVGIYCYDTDGTPTAVRTALGTLRLAGPPGPAPATVQLAGPVTEGEPVEAAAPTPGESGTEPTTTP
ncbi:hypothetical protein [Micromonospora inyonensis]|uniref:Lipoprotein n=1 Tax=Micromonospora inyonensis TaxID=47866 RepID=A0A1C6RCX9_9ACTN|nr:hypothetical protein [Micromonospora inyonensis]SCL14958.1 hypothetical protein GA0074694_0991 [Micromonospora inyonensis]